MSRPIVCKTCCRTFGSVRAPDADEIRRGMQGSKFAMFAYMIPPDVIDALAPILTFTCGNCGGIADGNQEKDERQEALKLDSGKAIDGSQLEAG